MHPYTRTHTHTSCTSRAYIDICASFRDSPRFGWCGALGMIALRLFLFAALQSINIWRAGGDEGDPPMCGFAESSRVYVDSTSYLLASKI